MRESISGLARFFAHSVRRVLAGNMLTHTSGTVIVKRSLGGITDLRVEIEEEEAEEGTVTVRMVLTLLVTNRPAVRALLALVEALKGAEWEPEGQ